MAAARTCAAGAELELALRAFNPEATAVVVALRATVDRPPHERRLSRCVRSGSREPAAGAGPRTGSIGAGVLRALASGDGTWTPLATLEPLVGVLRSGG